MSNLICPKCGRTNNQIEFIEAFCPDCYPIKIEIPKKIEFETCTRCEKIKFRGEWVPYNKRKLSDYILGKCKGDIESSTYDFESQDATFIMSSSAKVKRSIPLELKKTICQDCSRISGGYYEGIIQLRGDRKKIEKTAIMLISKLENVTFLTKTEEKDEGIDIYIGRSKPIVRLVSDLGITTVITKKLVGRDQGKRLYRTTFLIRMD
ncbi:MAG: NMD3-related protein [Candidatus Micrarchaeota archaeon]